MAFTQQKVRLRRLLTHETLQICSDNSQGQKDRICFILHLNEKQPMSPRPDI